MVDELAKYPADLVVDALRNWHNHSKWAPEVSDIAAYIKREHTARKSLVAALKNAPDATPAKKTGRYWHDLTDDEKDAHDKRMAELRKQIAENAKINVDT